MEDEVEQELVHQLNPATLQKYVLLLLVIASLL
jgi:hypothetical protein